MRINIKDKKNFIDMFNTLYKNNNINNINGISIDSRNFQKDDIFIALNGEKYNGNEYIDSIYDKSICCFSQYKSNKRKIIFNKSSQGTIAKLASNWRLLTNSTILGITGSNGKTTTKDLIHHIISKKFKCSKSIGNHNSLIGLPLSFLNTKISDEFSILELGANKPNEIEKLCNIIKPKYSLITNISNAHIKNYKSINDIINTKAAIYHSTPTNGTAFINADCNHYNKMDLNCKIKTFGFKNDADYRGELFYDDAYNLNIRINNESIKVPSHLSHLPNLILSAYVICNHFKISSRIFKNALDDFKLPSGRGQILKYKKCNVIDDTYNSNPSSLKLGIQRLTQLKIKNNKKILIIGDMLELGKIATKEHEKIGKSIDNSDINDVLLYGKLSQSILDSIKNSSINKKHFNDFNDLKEYLNVIINKDDWIYIKGSRSMKLERLFN